MSLHEHKIVSSIENNGINLTNNICYEQKIWFVVWHIQYNIILIATAICM